MTEKADLLAIADKSGLAPVVCASEYKLIDQRFAMVTGQVDQL